MVVKILGKNHSRCMTEHIRDCWDTECYSNVTFLCTKHHGLGSVKKTLSANKAVLAAGSRKLNLLLSETGDEDVNIIVPESDYETVKLLLEYIYTGEVLVDSLKDDLESLIAEWEIGYPQITPVGSSGTFTQFADDNQTPFSAVKSSPKKIVTRTKKDTQKISDKLTTRNPPKNFESTLTDHIYSKTSESAHTVIFPDVSNEEEDVNLPIYDNDILWMNENSSENVALDQNIEEPPVIPKSTKRKRVDKSDAVDPTAGVNDSEEDKGDALLSEAFLKEAKNRNQELTKTFTELADAIKRHEVYAKHFLGLGKSALKQMEKVEKDLDPRIPCELCGKNIRGGYMQDHMKSSHSSERPYLCEQCGATFALPEGLRRHISSVHPKDTTRHVCKFCDKTFRTIIQLRNHTLTHTGEIPYECPFCDKKFRFQSALYRHKRLHTGVKPYLCNVCGRQFADHSNYAGHLKSHNKDVSRKIPEFPCSTCGLKFDREYKLLIHEAVHTNRDPILPCSRCPNTFSSLKLLREHGRDEHGDVTFQCDTCPNFYTKKRGLDEHILLIHTIQEKNFTCDECTKAFKTNLKLLTHKKLVHSGIRPHKCSFCPKDFKVRKLCREHERSHTDERPYLCPHCPKAFRSNDQRNTHIRIHTGEKPFVCGECGKAFSARENLNTHTKIHTGVKNQCAKCGECFRTKVKLKLHESTCTEDMEDEQEKDDDQEIE